MTLKIERLPRAERYSFHSRPIRWQVTGPRGEIQKFHTRDEARIYAGIRRRSHNQSEAIQEYINHE